MDSIVNNVSSQTSQAAPKDSSGEVNGYYALLIALEGTAQALQGTAVVQVITTEALIQDENTINTEQTKDSYEQITWDMTHGTTNEINFLIDYKNMTKQADGTYIAKDGDIYTQAEVTADVAKFKSDDTTAIQESIAKYGTSKKNASKRAAYVLNYLGNHSVEDTIVPSAATLGKISNANLQIQALRDYLTGLVKIDTNIGQVLSANASSTASALTQAIDNFSSDIQTMTQIIQSIYKT